MLIVEGTDGIGKTTLCQRLLCELQESRPYVYRHLSKLPVCWKWPGSYWEHIARHVVQDRFHMSEIVYRIVRNEQQRLTPEMYRLLDARLRLVGAFTVVIVASKDVIAREHEKRDNIHTLEQHYVADHKYRDIINYEGISTYNFKVDWDFTCIVTNTYPAEDDTLCKLILSRYKQRQEELDDALGT